MENSSNNKPPKKVNEPETVYKSPSDTKEVDAFEHLPTHVKERLELALQEREKGLGKPHVQVSTEVTARYNFS